MTGPFVRALSWAGLVLVASTSAYGLQLTAAALMSSEVSVNQVKPETIRRTVLVVAVDPDTGDHAQVECGMLLQNFSSEMLLVRAEDFPAVARECNHRTASGGPTG